MSHSTTVSSTPSRVFCSGSVGQEREHLHYSTRLSDQYGDVTADSIETYDIVKHESGQRVESIPDSHLPHNDMESSSIIQSSEEKNDCFTIGMVPMFPIQFSLSVHLWRFFSFSRLHYMFNGGIKDGVELCHSVRWIMSCILVSSNRIIINNSNNDNVLTCAHVQMLVEKH